MAVRQGPQFQNPVTAFIRQKPYKDSKNSRYTHYYIPTFFSPVHRRLTRPLKLSVGLLKKMSGPRSSGTRSFFFLQVGLFLAAYLAVIVFFLLYKRVIDYYPHTRHADCQTCICQIIVILLDFREQILQRHRLSEPPAQSP